MLEKAQDLPEILGDIMSKLELLTERIERIEWELNIQETCGQTTSKSSTLTEDELEVPVPRHTAITTKHGIVNHAAPLRRSQKQVNPTIEMLAHAEHPATSASSLSPYHQRSAPSTPLRSQVPQSPRAHYQPQEEPSPLTPRTIPMRAMQYIPTPEQATSRLHVDQIRNTGPPFFVVFNGQEPGVFTDWPFVLRTCKWMKGDWKKYEKETEALEAYEEAYIHGGLKLIYRL